MNLGIDEKLKAFADSCPFTLYAVGGFVRDKIANLCGKTDIDICAPVTAERFCAAAEDFGIQIKQVYKTTGTVKILLDGKDMEFAAFRSDEYVRGVHTPVKSYFTEDIEKDARRRDFKCNAVYYDIKNEKVVDPLGGVGDIESKRVQTVRDPEKVFGEDGLRLMRLARISAATGFTPTDECLTGARANAHLIRDVVAERVFSELLAILQADGAYNIRYAHYKGLKILDDTRVLDEIIPELTSGRGMEQNAAFHSHDVLEHSLRTALYSDKSVRLAALLHDIGKPYCRIYDGNSYRHAEEGERIAREVLSRLKAPKKLIFEVSRLAALHMYDYDLKASERKVRKFIVKNYDLIDKILLLKQADFSGCRDSLNTAPCVTKWREIINKMREEGAPFNIKDLKVRGDKLISAGVPKERAAEALCYLLCECAAGNIKNEEKTLLKQALLFCGNKKY